MLVRGQYHRIPPALMKIPDLKKRMIAEVLKEVKAEVKKLVSFRFGSILRKTSLEDLEHFTWTKVLSEWRDHAPTFLHFLQQASKVRFDGLASSDTPNRTTKICAIAMAGATLIRARVQTMNAPQFINSLIMREAGATKRCFRRLSRLGVCVSHNSTLKTLKRMGAVFDSAVIKWKEDIILHSGECQEMEGILNVRCPTGEEVCKCTIYK